jgi:effector-binding domain-containing protein
MLTFGFIERIARFERSNALITRLASLPALVLLVLAVVAATVHAQPAAPPRSSPPGGTDSPSPLKPGDDFGTELTLPARTILYFRGRATWDTAFETLIDAFGSLNDYAERQGIKPNGNPMTIYTQTGDSGFEFWAALPIAQAPKDPPKGDIAVGTTPTGRALRFTHRGSYEALDTTYEAITNYLDDHQLDAKDTFIEEYASGPLKSTGSQLVVDVYVPLK